jgi:predicted amidophosphoribosyltransferase
MTGCRGRLPWSVVEQLLAAGATLTCRCGHRITGLPGVPGRCPRCGADLERAEFCWEIVDPPGEAFMKTARRRRP